MAVVFGTYVECPVLSAYLEGLALGLSPKNSVTKDVNVDLIERMSDACRKGLDGQLHHYQFTRMRVDLCCHIAALRCTRDLVEPAELTAPWRHGFTHEILKNLTEYFRALDTLFVVDTAEHRMGTPNFEMSNVRFKVNSNIIRRRELAEALHLFAVASEFLQMPPAHPVSWGVVGRRVGEEFYRVCETSMMPREDLLKVGELLVDIQTSYGVFR